MKVVRQYKTFNNETGEIRIDCKLIKFESKLKKRCMYSVVQNEEAILTTPDESEAFDYYRRLRQMDNYICSKVKWYEIYTII